MFSLPTHWSFLNPSRLWLLLVVAALAVAYLLLQRRRSRYETRFSDVSLLASVMPRRPGWRRHLPASLLVLTLVALAVSFARPSADLRVPQSEATIIVTLDVSASMAATDVPPDRIEAAKAGAAAFVRSLPATFAVGLVSFSGTAAIVQPPTRDRAAFYTALSTLQLGGGTAIGDAVSASIANAQSAKNTKAPVRIVLLSDGGNTVGRSVEAGAREAVAAGMPVTTIAYGTPNGVVRIQGQNIPVPVDQPALASLASATGGQTYTAQDNSQLANAYHDIGREAGSTTERRELTSALTGLGLLLGLTAAAGSLLWFRALP